MSDADVELFLWKFKKEYVINSLTKHADNIVIGLTKLFSNTVQIQAWLISCYKMSNPGVSYVILVLVSPPNEVPRCETRQLLPRLRALTGARCPPASSQAVAGADSRMSIGAKANDLASERTSDQFNLFLSCSVHPAPRLPTWNSFWSRGRTAVAGVVAGDIVGLPRRHRVDPRVVDEAHHGCCGRRRKRRVVRRLQVLVE